MDVYSVTDLTYLKDLAKGNEVFVKEMIGIFLTENPEEIKQLEKAIEEINFEKIKSISHHMKSTIPFVGIDKYVGNDLLQIEHLAAEKNEIESIQTYFAHVKLVCQQAFQELSA
jgi:HPt (histidine-containing phosphotransfer) domain-containing protein